MTSSTLMPQLESAINDKAGNRKGTVSYSIQKTEEGIENTPLDKEKVGVCVQQTSIQLTLV
jgi:hypothetical protein